MVTEIEEVRAEMFLSYSDSASASAYGTVTLFDNIKFSVQLRKYIDKETGEEKALIGYPRRQRDGKWEDVISPPKELREKIQIAVMEACKRAIVRHCEDNCPELEVLSVNRVPSENRFHMKAYIAGVASVRINGVLVQGVTIKKGENGYFVNMPQYKSADGYKDIVLFSDRALRDDLSRMVIHKFLELYPERDVREAAEEPKKKIARAKGQSGPRL